jgi:hypothetical protein
MEGFPKHNQWYLYDTTAGTTVLKHFYTHGVTVACPHCDQPLEIVGYTGACCGQIFTTSFGTLTQREPYGRHDKRGERGWRSLRPFIRMAEG